MSSKKSFESSRPPSYTDSSSIPGDLKADPSAPDASSGKSAKVNRSGTGKRAFSAYAQTWIGMTPVWLMGEALIPGVKVGTTFKGGANKLLASGEEILEMLGASKDDVIVVLDKHFAGAGSKITKNLPKAGGSSATATTGAGSTATAAGRAAKDGTSTPSGGSNWEQQASRAAQVIRAAGEHAIVAVSSSMGGAHDQLSENSPNIKRVVKKHGKDVVILVDKGLKNPIVVTGVSKFAKSKGIPYSDALLRLASLGLSKIIDALPDDVEAEVEAEVLDEAARRRAEEQRTGTTKGKAPAPRGAGATVEELDGEELERTSSAKAREEADRASLLGKDDDPIDLKATQGAPGAYKEGPQAGRQDPYENMRQKERCVVM